MEQRRELGPRPVARLEAELVGDRDDEVDDVPAVTARVLVVGLDHVAQQHRCTAVGGRELERIVEPVLALARERREEQQDGQQQQQGPRMAGSGEGDQQPEWSEQRVDCIGGSDRLQLLDGREPENRPGDDERCGEVEQQLGAEGGDVQRRVTPGRGPRSEEEDEGRPDGVPRTDDDERKPVDRHPFPRDLRRHAEDERAADDERQQPWRQQEPHRHEHALGRYGVARAELELHPGGGCITEDRHEERFEREGSVLGEEDEPDRDQREERREDPGRMRTGEVACRLRAAVLDERLVVERRAGGCGSRRSHGSKIGTPVRALDAGS